jgi:cofilin
MCKNPRVCSYQEKNFMTTGLAVSDDCLAKFNQLKWRNEYGYIIYVIEDKREIVVDKVGASDATIDDLRAQLSNKQPAYIVFKMKYMSKGGEPNSKDVFMLWLPDTAKAPAKMLYSAGKDNIRKKLEGVVEYEANDLGEVTVEAIVAKVVS